MGEDEWRIHITGALAIEAIKEIKMKSKRELFKEYRLDPETDDTSRSSAPDHHSKIVVMDNFISC